MELPKKVEIDRAKWRRMVYRDDHGCMCALGSLLNAAGAMVYANSSASAELMGLQRFELGILTHPSHGDVTPWARKVMAINDGPLLTEEREAKLTALFAERNIELTFTGEYTKVA